MTITHRTVTTYREELRARSGEFSALISDARQRFGEYREDIAREKVAGEAARLEAETLGNARLAWRTAEAAVEAQRARVVDARREADARTDHARVLRMRDELAARIALSGPQSTVDANGAVSAAGPVAGDPRLAVIRGVLDEVERVPDPEVAAALRMAAADVVASASSGTTQAAFDARELARRLNDAADSSAGVGEAVAELVALEREREALADQVLRSEREVTGRAPDPFGPSPWAREVLGVTVESLGGGVVVKPGALEGAPAPVA